jgi:TolB-like protein
MRAWVQYLAVGFGVVAALAFGAGCGGVDQSRQGASAYRAQEQRLKSTIGREPGNGSALRDLGEIYLRTGRPAKAYETLKDAYARTPKDPKTLFYLGLAAESVGKRSSAQELYRRYRQVSDSSAYRVWMRGRSLWLTHEATRRTIRSRLAEEDVRRRPVADRTVAVLPFACRSAHLSGPNGRPFGETVDATDIGQGLAAVVTHDLKHIRGIRPVAGVKVRALLQEVAPEQTAVSDPASVSHVGRLLGAGHIVGGECGRTDDGRLRLSITVAKTTGGVLSGIADRHGAPTDLFQLQNGLTLQIATAIGATLTPDERTAVADVPTEQLEAFQAYGQGLLAQTRNHFDDAVAHFRRAQSFDPVFEASTRALEQARALSKASGSWKKVLHRTEDIRSE